MTDQVLVSRWSRTLDRGYASATFVCASPRASWICPGIQHDSLLQQHDCARIWCHHLCLVLGVSCAKVYDYVKGTASPPDHLTYTFHLRLLLATLDTPELVHAFRTEVCHTLSVHSVRS